MDPLCRALLDAGALDDGGLALVEEHLDAHGGSADQALLELDLVDEEGLLAALAQVSGLAAATAADLGAAEPAAAARLPLAASETFRLCPLRLQPDGVVAVVTQRLPDRWEQELRDLFALGVTQVVASTHHLAVARHAVYGAPLDARTQALAERLARRRAAEGAGAVVAAMAAAPSLKAAAGELLAHGLRLLEFCCLLRPGADVARPWLIGRDGAWQRGEAALPLGPGCVFGAAVLHSGYFLGPIPESPAHRAFFAALGREVPRTAFVAPAPGTGEPALVLFGDNGPRGIAPRWVAELSLLTARLGQWHPAPGARPPEVVLARPEPASTRAPAPPAEAPPEPESQPQPQSPPQPQPDLSAEDRATFARLRAAAAAAGQPPAAFLEQLLTTSRARPEPPAAPTVGGGEVKELLNKLASDIPTQLARGVENAFREMLGRLGPQAAAAPAAGAAPARATPAATVELVTTATAQPREVPDYRARRRKIETTKF
jgi:hypothetical protein